MKNKLTYILLTILFINFISLRLIAESDNTEKILNSDPVKSLKNLNKKNSRRSVANNSNWLKPGSNFSKLFLEKDPVMLYDWLGHKKEAVKVDQRFCGNTKEFAYLTRHYLTSDNKKLVLNTLIPHPRYSELVTYGFIKDFASLEPPKLDIKYSENIIIEDKKAEVFYHDDLNKTCSILFKTTKNSRVNLLGPCTKLEDLKNIAKNLSFERFDKKLNS